MSIFLPCPEKSQVICNDMTHFPIPTLDIPCRKGYIIVVSVARGSSQGRKEPSDNAVDMDCNRDRHAGG